MEPIPGHRITWRSFAIKPVEKYLSITIFVAIQVLYPEGCKLSRWGFKKISHIRPLVTTFFNDPDFFGLSLTVCPSHDFKFLNGGAVDWKKIIMMSYTDHENIMSSLPSVESV